MGGVILSSYRLMKRKMEKQNEELETLNDLVYISLKSADVGVWWIDFGEHNRIHALDVTVEMLGLPQTRGRIIVINYLIG